MANIILVFDQKLRLQTKKVIKPIVIKTGLVRINPDLVSLTGFLFGMGSVLFILLGHNIIALCLWLLNRFVDGLDGEVARYRKSRPSNLSDAGGFLDITLDSIIYAAIPFAIGLARDEKQLWIIIAFLLAAIYVNTVTWAYLAALIEKSKTAKGEHKTAIVIPSGLIEGTETIILYSSFLIFFKQAGLLMLLMGILVTLTALYRFVKSYFAIKRSTNK